MKRTLRILAAGLAASLALVSCDKESLTKTDNGATKDGVRTITVSFADVTRSELNGLQPSFKVGDKIMVSNGSKSEECTVSIDKGVASITISDGDLKEAELTAVYPAAAWINSDPYFKVSTEQDGTFANANICKATIPAGSKDAVFENQTAILKFSVPAKADDKGVNYSPKTIKVKSRGSENIADGSNEITITGKGENGIITPSDGGFYYMAVLPGETISKLTVCSGEGMRCPTASGTLTANFIYDVALPVLNGHEYVELTMTFKSVTKTYKWATMNVGATEANPNGLYFAWGETTGHAAATNGENAFLFGIGNAGFDSGWKNCPYATTDDPKFSKYVPSDLSEDYWGGTGSADNKTELEFSDDAACQNWGSTWRMPTKDELSGLAYLDSRDWDDDNKGFRIKDANGNSIFLPAAGYGRGTDLCSAGIDGHYWSSSLNFGDPFCASGRRFRISSSSTGMIGRYFGYSVRPLSE